ncbi:hypothetical protein H4R24_002917 [Coemansia sp. RSA 988]|nr:hypothetical protein H4R24_002917 [Coemansia sp. RSA 988]
MSESINIHFISVYNRETEAFEPVPFLDEPTPENVSNKLEEMEASNKMLHLAYNAKKSLCKAGYDIEWSSSVSYFIPLRERKSSDPLFVSNITELVDISRLSDVDTNEDAPDQSEEGLTRISLNESEEGTDGYTGFPRIEIDEEEETDEEMDEEEKKELRSKLIKQIRGITKGDAFKRHQKDIDEALGETSSSWSIFR